VIYEADSINDAVLLIDAECQVVDAFAVHGKTRHESQAPAVRYTFRGLVYPPGRCCLCDRSTAEIQTPCVSSGGCHAFVGVADAPDIPSAHKAENRNAPLVAISYDELVFYVEADNLFPVSEIQKPIAV